ncbi:protein LEAD-SENSITIVE 1-like [Tasmannia lanceolata]|uniref:protein LEAD-SENSITIVE 1-like n=1 Tax=Tasmannia lanceolata TaxID=3420 RepID=UPI004063C3A0
MGVFFNRVEKSQIKAGDHIYSWRAIYTYSHHGIYVGGNLVMHFTCDRNKSSGMSSSFNPSSFNSGMPTTCLNFPECGFRQPNSGVLLSCLDCFLGNGSLYRFEYGVSVLVFLAKVRGGTCTTATSDPPKTVIQRAMYLLLRYGFGDYHVFDNNCEDFALYCKTGLVITKKSSPGRSGQTFSFFAGAPVAAVLSNASKFFVTCPVGKAVVSVGAFYTCRYLTDIGVRTDVIKVPVEDMDEQTPKENKVSDAKAPE